MTINWNTNDNERKLIIKVVERLEQELGYPMEADEVLQHSMNLAACHLNGTKLDFEKLLAFDKFSFMHDINGIASHINKDTGKIERNFLPRSAA